VKVAAVVLAGGASLRLGTPKQLIRLGGEALVERTVRICREAGCDPVVVVLGSAADKVRSTCSLEDAMVVMNRHWHEGMASSIAQGVSALEDGVDGCVITTCDMPAVLPDHLRRLADSGEMTASAYAGRHGVPAYFPRDRFPQLMSLTGDTGARDLLKSCPAIPLDGGELDIDTPQDLERAIELFG
jgi:molybdenum cofactor cytidylyltransferase